jgi:hypothetical protein
MREQGNHFLPGPEHFTWNEVEGLDDFVVMKAPISQEDNLSSTLIRRIENVLSFFRTTLPAWTEYTFAWAKYKLSINNPPKTDLPKQENDDKKAQDQVEERETPSPGPELTAEAVAERKELSEEIRRLRRHIQIQGRFRIAGVISAFIIAVLAAMFPVLSMLGLYFIKGTLKKMFTLLGLTVVFAFMVKSLTAAKSSEIFAAAAAFVAVEVVFVASPTLHA